jgi:guanine deaminase
MDHQDLMRVAIRLSVNNVTNRQGGPFGAVIARNGEIIAEGANFVTSTNDPTAHAEVVAIRSACNKLGEYQLKDCQIYCSCEPCPMCLGAIYWARLGAVYYANTQEDAAAIFFDDQFIYDEINRPISERSLPTHQLLREEAWVAFQGWLASDQKIKY